MGELAKIRQSLINTYGLYESKCLALNIESEPLIHENYYYKVINNKIHCVGFVDELLIPNDLVVDEVFDVFDIEFYSVSKKDFNSITIPHKISFGFDFQFNNLNIKRFELNKAESITLPLFFECKIGEFNAPLLKYLCSHTFEESSVDFLNIPNLKMVSMATFENMSLSFLDLSHVELLTVNLCAYNKKLERLTIKPYSILGERMCRACEKLKVIDNIETVSFIPNNCFYSSGIEELNLYSVTGIAEKAFANSNLRKLVLSSNLKNVDAYAFNGIESLEIDFYGSKEDFLGIKVLYGNDAFLNAKVNYLKNG